jgi:hypothetical protein
MDNFGPNMVESRLRPAEERRKAPRRRVLFTGKIVYINNSYSADCTIRDLSTGGARILVRADAMLADPFLIVVKEAVVHQSRTAWIGLPLVGLEFVKSTPLSGEAPLHLKAIQRLWVELMPR